MHDPAPLPEDLTQFIQSGLSITVASCGPRRVPSIAKGVGCRVSADRRAVTVLVFADQADTVLQDLREGRPIAVCFSRPSTHQTVQLKSARARCEPAAPPDVAVARRCLDLLVDDLEPISFTRRMLEAFFWRDPAQLQAVSFAPEGAYAQTPGPSAGAPIGGAGAA